MIAVLLAAFIACADGRDAGAPPWLAGACPVEKQKLMCRCGETMWWDPWDGTGTRPMVVIVERYSLGQWTEVGRAQFDRLWFNHGDDRPLTLPGFLYQYRLWSVASDGVTRSALPSSTIYYRGIPRTCVDPVSYQKVSCWP